MLIIYSARVSRIWFGTTEVIRKTTKRGSHSNWNSSVNIFWSIVLHSKEREIYIERVLIKIMRVFDCIKNRERVMRCENLVKYHREMCVKEIIRASFFLDCCRFLVFYVMFFAMHKHTWSSRYSLRTIPWLFEASRNLYHAISNVGFSIRIQFTLNIVVYYHCRSTRVWVREKWPHWAGCTKTNIGYYMCWWSRMMPSSLATAQPIKTIVTPPTAKNNNIKTRRNDQTHCKWAPLQQTNKQIWKRPFHLIRSLK